MTTKFEAEVFGGILPAPCPRRKIVTYVREGVPQASGLSDAEPCVNFDELYRNQTCSESTSGHLKTEISPRNRKPTLPYPVVVVAAHAPPECHSTRMLRAPRLHEELGGVERLGDGPLHRRRPQALRRRLLLPIAAQP